MDGEGNVTNAHNLVLGSSTLSVWQYQEIIFHTYLLMYHHNMHDIIVTKISLNQFQETIYFFHTCEFDLISKCTYITKLFYNYCMQNIFKYKATVLRYFGWRKNLLNFFSMGGTNEKYMKFSRFFSPVRE